MSIAVRILATAAASVAATGLALAPAGAAPARAQPGTQQQAPDGCHRADLDIRAGRTEAAAGTTFRRINFVNTGARPCTLRGWPRVTFHGAAGNRIGRPSLHVGARAGLVTIPGGQRAHVNVGVPNPDNFPPADCRARRAHEIAVTPPHRRFTVRLAWTIEVCAKPAGRTSVDALHRGGP
jgi:hypothetical protein